MFCVPLTHFSSRSGFLIHILKYKSSEKVTMLWKKISGSGSDDFLEECSDYSSDYIFGKSSCSGSDYKKNVANRTLVKTHFSGYLFWKLLVVLPKYFSGSTTDRENNFSWTLDQKIMFWLKKSCSITRDFDSTFQLAQSFFVSCFNMKTENSSP